MLNLWEREEIICFLRNWKRLIVCKGSWIHSSHSRTVRRLTGLLFLILPSPGGPEKRLREPPWRGRSCCAGGRGAPGLTETCFAGQLKIYRIFL